MKRYRFNLSFAFLLAISLFLNSACSAGNQDMQVNQGGLSKQVETGSPPETYTAQFYGTFEDASTPYKIIHENKPYFTNGQKKKKDAFETYAKLDSLGRCGVAFANICPELMPTEKRGAIGMIKPSGWHTIKYDCISDRYLYNRCHLIGYQLAGENANPENLITGTRYLNVDGMLPFENKVADFVRDTGYHVLYRVTPIYEGNNLVAHGVLMEGYSVEDHGKGIEFCVFCYNAQPKITIDYTDGLSQLRNDAEPNQKHHPASQKKKSHDNLQDADSKNNSSDDKNSSTDDKNNSTDTARNYILCLTTNKFHKPSCRHVSQISIQNRKSVKWKRTKVIKKGYVPCKVCKP